MVGKPKAVRISARAFDATLGEFLVWVRGRVVANFIYSSNPDDWHGSVTSKDDAHEAARAAAIIERERLGHPPSQTTFDQRPIGTDGLRQREAERFDREAQKMLHRYRVSSTGSSICGPDDGDGSTCS